MDVRVRMQREHRFEALESGRAKLVLLHRAANDRSDDLWRKPGSPDHPDFHDGYTAIRARYVPSTCKQPRRRKTIVVTDLDARRLRALVRRKHHETHDAGLVRLEAELMHAAIVEARAVPGNVITMNSRLLCEDERTGLWSRLKLVYPSCVMSHGDISVLSPLGTALLGVRIGQIVEARAAEGAVKRLRVTALPYQPERAGDYHL